MVDEFIVLSMKKKQNLWEKQTFLNIIINAISKYNLENNNS